MNCLGWDFLFDADRAASDRITAAVRRLVTVEEAVSVQKLTEGRKNEL